LPILEAVREPGGTEAGEAIREVMFGAGHIPLRPLTWAFLMNSARAQLVEERIRPALDRDITVLADRYWYSTLAYQGGGDEIDDDVIRTLARLATGALEPELVIYLRLPPDAVARRKSGLDPNVLDRRPLDFHQRVAQAYEKMVAADPDRWKPFDATLPKEHLAVAIRETVSRI